MGTLFAYKRDLQRLWAERITDIELPALVERERILRCVLSQHASMTTVVVGSPSSLAPSIQQWIHQKRRQSYEHLSGRPMKRLCTTKTI